MWIEWWLVWEIGTDSGVVSQSWHNLGCWNRLVRVDEVDFVAVDCMVVDHVVVSVGHVGESCSCIGSFLHRSHPFCSSSSLPTS